MNDSLHVERTVSTKLVSAPAVIKDGRGNENHSIIIIFVSRIFFF